MKRVNPWISHLQAQSKKLKVKINEILKNPALLARVKASYVGHTMDRKR